MIRDFDQMVSNVSLDKDNTERIQVFDARPPNLFYGIIEFIYNKIDFYILFYSGTDAGHMPNVVNLPYGSLFDQENQYIKTQDQLKESKILIFINIFNESICLFKCITKLVLIYQNLRYTHVKVE